MRIANLVGHGVFVCTLSACLADQADTSSHVEHARILAIVANPPEALPGQNVSYQLLLATPDGPATSEDVRWSYCLTPRPLTENGAVASACARNAERPLATSESDITASIPEDACARFGPEGDASLRPADADITGGYYQPLRAALADGTVAILRERIRCNLANAPIDVAQDYERGYRPNLAPQIASFAGLAQRVKPGSELELAVTVTASSVESYVVYDTANNRLQTRNESLEATWFATRGQLEHARSSLGARGDGSLSSPATASNHWTAPDEAGDAWLWVLVRDDRGALSVAQQHLIIAP